MTDRQSDARDWFERLQARFIDAFEAIEREGGTLYTGAPAVFERVAACFGAHVDIIGPCGFAGGDREIARVAMDYALAAAPVFHDGWAAFFDRAPSSRLVLLTTRGATDLWVFRFAPDDIILLGRESAGVPDEVHDAADARVRILLAAGARSLNVAVAGAVALAEARRRVRY